jgi:putative oxidoreductase
MAEPSELPKFIPGLAWYRPLEPYAYAFLRFCTGGMVVAHGVNRLFYGGTTTELGSLARVSAGAVGTFELIAGAMLALGVLTRPVALLLALEWLLIAAAVPVRPGASWLLMGATPHHPALLAIFCIAFMLGGGGHCSLDRSIGKEV